MINDNNLRVSTAQALTTTAVSADSVDLGVARDVGDGENLFMVFTVNAALTGGTSVDFQVVCSAAGALSSPTVIGSSGPIAAAQLTAGRQIPVRINPRPIGLQGQRFIGAQYTIAGTFSAGTVTADMVKDYQDGRDFYASGFSVL